MRCLLEQTHLSSFRTLWFTCKMFNISRARKKEAFKPLKAPARALGFSPLPCDTWLYRIVPSTFFIIYLERSSSYLHGDPWKTAGFKRVYNGTWGEVKEGLKLPGVQGLQIRQGHSILKNKLVPVLAESLNVSGWIQFPRPKVQYWQSKPSSTDVCKWSQCHLATGN